MCDHDDVVKPLIRPRGYEKIERRKGKHQKRPDWGKKGGYAAPINIPSTLDGILAKMLRQVADSEATPPNLMLKIVENGGRRLESILSRPTQLLQIPVSEKTIQRDHV